MLPQHENKFHGRVNFPYTLYPGRIPEWMNDYPIHWHDEMEIIYILNGTLIVNIQNEDIVIHSGELAVVQPQIIHSMRQCGSESSRYFTILFRPELLESSGADICSEKYIEPIISRCVTLPKCIKKEHEYCDIIGCCARTLYRIRSGGEEGNELIIKSLLFQLIHYLSLCAEPENAQEHYIRSLHEKLKKSLEYVHRNYPEEITVEKAAAISNFSPSHFSKLFRTLTGSSFTQYLKNCRLEAAAAALRSSDVSVSEAALSCGFNNLSYFTRSFRTRYGITPQEYKKRI